MNPSKAVGTPFSISESRGFATHVYNFLAEEVAAPREGHISNRPRILVAATSPKSLAQPRMEREAHLLTRDPLLLCVTTVSYVPIRA